MRITWLLLSGLLLMGCQPHPVPETPIETMPEVEFRDMPTLTFSPVKTTSVVKVLTWPRPCTSELRAECLEASESVTTCRRMRLTCLTERPVEEQP